MPGFLIGSAYAVSVGLIIFAVSTKLAPTDWQFPLVMAWAIAGLVLAFVAVLVPRRRDPKP
jgi:membrane protein implicated in regulation of membrane protease activity